MTTITSEGQDGRTPGICGDCRFWDDKGTEYGACRRYAPRAAVRPDTPTDELAEAPPLWPRTYHEDWCGEHEPD